mgnify:CR=1 FL=1
MGKRVGLDEADDSGRVCEGGSKLFTFATLTDLLSAEWECQQIGVSTQIEPVSPMLAQGCHMCLSVSAHDATWLVAKLEAMGMAYGCYDKPAPVL